MQLGPAEYVIYVFKGVRKTARAIGVSPNTVSLWKKPRVHGGTDGQVPRNSAAKILAYAVKHGLDIQLKDLTVGRRVKASDYVNHLHAS